MANFEKFQAAGGSVFIELADTDSPGSGKQDLREVMRLAAMVADASAEELRRIREERQPGEVEIVFTVRAFSGGGAAIGLVGGAANFRVCIKWTGNAQSGVLGGETLP